MTENESRVQKTQNEPSQSDKYKLQNTESQVCKETLRKVVNTETLDI